MNIQLHQNARTTPAIRLELQAQPQSVSNRALAVSRSGLDRCLRRHGVSNLKALLPKEEGAKTPVKAFKDYAPGFVHVDVKYLPQMPDEDQRQYLFAAIDRATRWVYVELLKDKSAAPPVAFSSA